MLDAMLDASVEPEDVAGMIVVFASAPPGVVARVVHREVADTMTNVSHTTTTVPPPAATIVTDVIETAPGAQLRRSVSGWIAATATAT
jgi:hypothetical protein